jgi:hypothetical protein
MEVLPDAPWLQSYNNTFNYIDPYPNRATAQVPGLPDAEAIRGEMAAIPDREGGNILNLGVDQRRGEAQPAGVRKFEGYESAA